MRILLLTLFVSSGWAAAQSTFETTTSLFGDLTARQIGPALMSGRVSCLAVHPDDPTVVYIGAAGGGIWKTDNAGATLDPIFDDYTQSIGAIALAPSDPEVVYVGTGEPWTRNSVSIGDGVYRSEDGGRRWTSVGLEGTERIAGITIHPDDPNTVYVAALGPLWSDGTDRGVYKSTDGGQNWERVLYLSPSTGAANISMDRNNPDVLFVAMWDHRRTPYSFDSGYGGQSGLYRTTDGGDNWEKLGNGLPDEKLGRIAVEVAPGNSKVVYASVETGTNKTKGMYRSHDGGDSWTLTDRTFNNQVRPFYFAELSVDPSNDSIVAKCGLNAIISENRGETWRTFDGRVHSDAHDIWIDPANGRHILLATDGGVYESQDRGRTFKMWQNLPVSQFYHVSVDQAEPYRVYGGLQDNGSWYGPSQKPGGITNADWYKTMGGDGFYSFRHPTKPHYVFSEYQGGGLVRYDERTGQTKAIAPYADESTGKLRFNWNAPIHVSKNGERLYFAGQYLFRSADDGENWERISPDLTTNDTSYQQQHRSGGLSIDNSGAENYTTIYAVAESPVDNDIVWVGTDDGNLQATTDGGDSWTELSDRLPGAPEGSWVTSVEPSPHAAETAFVTLDNHRRGDMGTYVYRTDDGGISWRRLMDDDLEGYALSVRQDPVNPDLLFLGTEMGLFISLDGGDSWAPFRNNLPRVGIRDMVIQEREADLVLATHGRGVIILDDLEALRQLTPEITEEKIAFLETEPTYFYDGGASGAGRFSGSGIFVGGNPSQAARIMYYAGRRHTFGKMYVEIYRDGELIRTLPAGKSAGLNVVSLQTRLPKPKSPPSESRQASFGTTYGPSLPAGTYQVNLVKGRDTFQTDFTLAAHPDSPYGEAERKQQYDLLMRLYNDSESLAYHYEVLSQLEQQLDTLSVSQARLADTRTALLEKVRRQMGRIVFRGGDGYVNEGQELGEEVSVLYSAVSGYPGAPSGSQVKEADRLHHLVEEAGDRAESVVRQVENLNAELAPDDRLNWPDRESYLAAE
jgi:photosystem II stability/assembly factor-like uncharacterized protein